MQIKEIKRKLKNESKIQSITNSKEIKQSGIKDNSRFKFKNSINHKSSKSSKNVSQQSLHLNLQDIISSNNNQEKITKNFPIKMIKNDEEEVKNASKESKISKRISERRTKKLILIIILLFIIIPVLQIQYLSFNVQTCKMIVFFISRINMSMPNSSINQTIFNLITTKQDPNFPVLNITVNNEIYYQNKLENDKEYRIYEIAYQVSSSGNRVLVAYSNKMYSYFLGLIGIFRTLVIGSYIILSTYLFENDVNKIIVEPFDIMVEIMQRIEKDPINAKNATYLKKGIKYWLKEESNRGKKTIEKKQEESYELRIITSSLIKISSLLATGFGEAGGNIIKKCISSEKGLDTMLKGKRKLAIFGFCDIRKFSEINIALQEKTMVFVNEIAEIIHSSVDRFKGATNKNIGEAFLISWKLEKEINIEGYEANINYEKNDNSFTNMCDNALISFLHIIIKINKNPKILEYKNNKEILFYLKNMKKNFKVNMGFGLQMGWAIEGAIGSSYKFDASYLSPFVNMAARLEAATRQYGVSILISGTIYKHLSYEMKSFCRLIDVVTVKGSVNPVNLYTVDVNLDLKPSTKNYSGMKLEDRLRLYNMKKEKTEQGILKYGTLAKYVLSKKSFQELLKKKKSELFYPLFKNGFENYIEGYWSEAYSNFIECLYLDNDGPTRTLFAFMKKYDFQSPKNWKGFRELTSK